MTTADIERYSDRYIPKIDRDIFSVVDPNCPVLPDELVVGKRTVQKEKRITRKTVTPEATKRKRGNCNYH
jgi:hypothetical protein